ncbi:DUF6531 domain-containing protein [Streptomyces hirsutus]|uniref:DUF6531 domain-containing protein n=1 Tax=Streptomyces hirsutus TaxID=35620 RepID=UPI003D15F963
MIGSCHTPRAPLHSPQPKGYAQRYLFESKSSSSVALAALSAGAASATATPLPDRSDQRQQASRPAADEPVVVDVEVASTGHPFTLTRFYHWDPEVPSGLLGKGWRLSFEANLLPSSSTVILDDTDGTVRTFTAAGRLTGILDGGEHRTAADERDPQVPRRPSS